MKYGLTSAVLGIGLVLSLGRARADVLVLTSPQIEDNDTLAVKKACADKQRSPNCVGQNPSPPLAWSGVPRAPRVSLFCCSIPKDARLPAYRVVSPFGTSPRFRGIDEAWL
jgi:hypothetical protein